MKINIKYILAFLILLITEMIIALFVKDAIIRPFIGAECSVTDGTPGMRKYSRHRNASSLVQSLMRTRNATVHRHHTRRHQKGHDKL